ncbi:Carnitine O-acetyltransferase-like [Oopsacas minuta]|uniref:Carnitine O-acetyltransferase-like n=1 Tax=Oopsacas minuta TaxID=111878 RepID=A0AAV7KB97_9METZ|nr:Carnitine O-acetyltransferase-like [Oopsacas minuta]
MSIYQKLPRIMVPKLDNTIERYLEVMKAQYKFTTYSEIVYYTRIFARMEGIYFQNVLMEHSESNTNWAAKIWVNQSFLENRISLLYTNETRGSVNKLNWSTTDQMLTAISQYISTIINFWEDVRQERVPQDYVGDMPQCMEQYKRIMGVHRRSLPKIDNWHSTSYSKYIIVMVEGRMFQMRVYDNKEGRPYPRNEIKELLKKIISHSKDEDAQPEPVGTLTAMDRDNWFCIREEMSRSSINKQSLSIIEQSLFGLCIDETYPKPNNVFTQTTLGDHRYDFKNFNRWYDLGLQCVFRKDGYFTWITEQSIYDGAIIPQPKEVVIEDSKEQSSQKCQNSDVKIINWDLSNTTKMNIERGKNKLINWWPNLDNHVFEFTDFGLEYLQKYDLHANGLVQQAIVLAYYKLYNQLDSMCQPVSLRRYRSGRKEHPHIVTCENRKFVEAMENKNIIMEVKWERLEKAIQKHHSLIADASHLNHYFRGLMALNWIIEHEFIFSDFFLIRFWKCFSKPKVVVIYSDTQEPAISTGIPTYESGHYIYFHPKKNSILFSINTVLKSLEFKTSNRFASMLELSLLEIKHLLENRFRDI